MDGLDLCSLPRGIVRTVCPCFERREDYWSTLTTVVFLRRPSAEADCCTSADFFEEAFVQPSGERGSTYLIWLAMSLASFLSLR